MTKRDFLILIIKLFGLYCAVTNVFSGIPRSLVFSLEYNDFIGIFWIAVSIVVTVGLFLLLTIRADDIVDILKLDKGFADDRIEFGNIKSEDIIKIGTFIIGGLLFIENVPVLLSQLYWAFKGEVVGQEFLPKDKLDLGITVLNVLLGYLLFANYDVVAKQFKRNKRDD